MNYDDITYINDVTYLRINFHSFLFVPYEFLSGNIHDVCNITIVAKFLNEILTEILCYLIKL